MIDLHLSIPTKYVVLHQSCQRRWPQQPCHDGHVQEIKSVNLHKVGKTY